MGAIFALTLLAARFALAQDNPTSGSGSKRGLTYVSPNEDPADDRIWNSDQTDLSWYYNWSPNPTGALSERLEFVPMQWGEDGAQSFYDTVKRQIDSGSDIKSVLGFNEPDGCTAGGSCVDAETAASLWIDQIEPLKELGLTLGSPSVTGSPRGLQWMQEFFTYCDGGCSPDFFAAHWYGNFEGLASFLGQVNATYPNMTLWVTEYAYPEVDLKESQAFFNQSTDYLDRLPFCERYSYFGSFRSDVSNVGPNAAMLTQKGDLTDIGAWYLGQPELAEGNKPKGGDASHMAKFAGWAGVVMLAAVYGGL